MTFAHIFVFISYTLVNITVVSDLLNTSRIESISTSLNPAFVVSEGELLSDFSSETSDFESRYG
jgi:hypothetical protein